MGVVKLWSHLSKVGGPKQWETKADEELKSANAKGKRRKRKREEEAEERKKWIRENRKEEDEWIVEFDDPQDAKKWIETRRGVLGLGQVDKVAIDLGQLAYPLEKLRKKLEQSFKYGRLTKEECFERFEFGRLRLYNSVLQEQRLRFGQQIRPCIGIDHPDQREGRKRPTLIKRFKPSIEGESRRTAYKLARERTNENKAVRAQKRAFEKWKKERQAEMGEEEDREEDKFTIVPAPKEEEPVHGRSLDTAEEPLPDIEEEVPYPMIVEAEQEDFVEDVGGGREFSIWRNEEADDAVNDGTEASERQPLESDETGKAQSLEFPLKPVNQDYIDSCSQSAWGQANRREATLLISTTEQAYARTECDYLLPTYLLDDTLHDDDARVEHYVPRSVAPVPPPSSPSNVDLPPTRVVVSPDSDLTIAVDKSSTDFIWSTYSSRGRTVHRIVDVSGMYSGLGWTDKFEAAALAGLIGNDFTDGGVRGVGPSILLSKADKFKPLRIFAGNARACLDARDRFDSSPSSSQVVTVGSYQVNSLDQMRNIFDQATKPFYHKSNSSNSPRITLDVILDSVAIQTGGKTTDFVSKKEIREELSTTAERKIRSGFRTSQGTKTKNSANTQLETGGGGGEGVSSSRGEESSTSSQPRQHQVTFKSRHESALPFDPLPASSNDDPQHFGTREGYNGPTLLTRLKGENVKLMEYQGSIPQTDQGKEEEDHDDEPPPLKKGKFVEEVNPEADESGEDEGQRDDQEKAGDEMTGAKMVPREKEGEKQKRAKKVNRFPNDLKAKTVTDRKFASPRNVRDLVLEGVEDLPNEMTDFLSWIWQWGVIEMPRKVELINRVLSYYYLFPSDRLSKLVKGGDEFTKWAATIVHRRVAYDQHQDKSEEGGSGINGNTLATLVDLEPFLKETKRSLSPERRQALDAMVLERKLVQDDLDFIRTNKVTDTIDFFVYLAVIDHHKAGLDCPLLVDSAFDGRNFVNFGTSFSNSTSTYALSIDWILAKLIVNSPTHLFVHHDSVPFGLENDNVRSAISKLDDLGRSLLSLLPRSSLALQRIREALGLARIGRITGKNDNLDSIKTLLRSQLLPILQILATTSLCEPRQFPINTVELDRVVTSVIDVVVEAVDWFTRILRSWVEFFPEMEEVDTLERWIVKAGGSARSIVEEGVETRKAEKSSQKGGKKRSSSQFLENLKVVAASFSSLRQRPYRYSPNMIHVNLQIIDTFANKLWLFEEKLKIALARLESATKRQNRKTILSTSLTPFEPPLAHQSLPPISSTSKSFDTKRVTTQTLRRLKKNDQTMKRQFDHPEKAVFGHLNHWRGIPFEKDSSTGPFLVQEVGITVTKKIEKTVKTVRNVFKKIGLDRLKVNVASTFVMEVLFKPTFGRRLPNGDIGLSANEWHFGVVDPRFRDLDFVKKMSSEDQLKTSSEMLIEGLNADTRLADPVRKMWKNLEGLEERITRIVELPEAERQSLINERKRTNSAFSDSRDGMDPPIRQRKRPLPTHREETEHRKVVSRFGLVDGVFTFPLPSDLRFSTPPTDLPIRVAYDTHPHLPLREIPGDAHPLNPSVRARNLSLSLFAEAEKEESLTQPTAVVDDFGQHYAVARSIFAFGVGTSSRHFVKQKRFALNESQNNRVLRELENLNPAKRLANALPDPSNSSLIDQMLVKPPLPPLPPPATGQQPFVPYNYGPFPSSPSLSLPPIPPPSANPSLPAPTLHIPFAAQLSQLEPILQHGVQPRVTHLSSLRTLEQRRWETKNHQAEASAEVREAFPRPEGWTKSDPRRSVLYVTSKDSTPSGGKFGRDVSGHLQSAFTTALASSPHVDGKVVTCSEGNTSSVCPDSSCRASLLRPCRVDLSPVNRIKFCIWQQSMDNRDGLAGANILAILYHVAHGFVGNPLSIEVAQGMNKECRANSQDVETTEKLIGRLVEGKSKEECEKVMASLGESDSVAELRRVGKALLKSSMSGVVMGFDEDDEGDGEGNEGDGEAATQTKRKSRRGGRGRGRRKRAEQDAEETEEE
ncbi:uncharacterized protein JCM6883_002337 [Sporobolomyces salmoneus]|uniref:uncharacterized protein n=1 Tax=Sporobolomyces salmoneus TaxID=183962 RepID=UPI00317E6E8D